MLLTVCVGASPCSHWHCHNQLTIVFTADCVPSTPEHMQIGKEYKELGFL